MAAGLLLQGLRTANRAQHVFYFSFLPLSSRESFALLNASLGLTAGRCPVVADVW
jgi:hypothetical protein